MTGLSRRAFAILAVAAACLPVVPALADSSTDARQFISDLAGQGISLAADKSLSDQQRRDKFRQLFVSNFDLPAIGQFVLGRYWRTASADQQQRFLQLFQEMQVLTWSGRFKEYHGEKVEVLAANQEDGGSWAVDSRITRPNGDPIPVQWKIRQADSGFKVTDLVVAGASMALTQRQDFTSVFQQEGGKFDNLIAAIQKKVDQMRSQS